jgi:hypothetical protein
MNNIYVYVFILIIFLTFTYIDYIKIYVNDLIYAFKQIFINKKKVNDNFSLDDISKIKNNVENIKMLIISFDNRITLNYIEDHNKNITKYCEKHKNIEYEFITKYDKNVYWSKIYLVLEKLLTNNYDYVMWMDTDTIFVNNEIDIRNMLLLFNTDIFIGYDSGLNYSENTLNAGVFIIKNSINGINFIKELIYNVENSKCINNNNSLNGIYSLTCYEQGAMNDLIYNKYFNFTTILSEDIISNGLDCKNDKIFILHNFGSNYFNIDVKTCFNKINDKLII